MLWFIWDVYRITENITKIWYIPRWKIKMKWKDQGLATGTTHHLMKCYSKGQREKNVYICECTYGGGGLCSTCPMHAHKLSSMCKFFFMYLFVTLKWRYVKWCLMLEYWKYESQWLTPAFEVLLWFQRSLLNW